MENEYKWNIKEVSLKDLKLLDNNPRKISKEALERLKNKIINVGFHNPLIIDNNNVIIGGNQRFKILKEMYGEDYKIKVRFPEFELSEQQRKEIVIADNIQDGEWDYEKLATEYEDINLEDLGLNATVNTDDIEEEVEEVSKNIEKKYSVIIIPAENDKELEELYGELTGLGYKCHMEIR